MKQAIVHLGMPKTATTSCQNALWRCRTALAREGWLYPSVEANHTNALCTMFLPDPRQHITVRSRGITTEDAAEALRAEYFATLEAELAQPGWHTLILSAEGLSNLSEASLGALRDWLLGYVDHVKAFYWLRHPVSYSVSVMQQMLKGGETIEQMLTALPLTNYRGKLTNALAVFGRESTRISRFEDAVSHPKGPVFAFCQALGLPSDISHKAMSVARTENESMSLLAAHALDALNRRRPLFIDGAPNPKRHPAELAQFMRIRGPKFDLTAGQKQMIRTASRPEMEWLSQTFGQKFYPDIFSDAPFEETAAPPSETADTLGLTISDLVLRRWVA